MRTHTKRQRRNRPGHQHLWGFDNGHLASVVPDAEAKNLWELTILDGNGRASYHMPSVPNVIGSLKAIEVRRLLREIEGLR
jgi:hypothetical protein